MKHIHHAGYYPPNVAEVVLLGIAQDGGRPQAGCNEACCIGLSPTEHSYPTSLGIVDKERLHIIDVTRHLPNQLQFLENRIPTDVWLTHAHFGHVDGLGLFGKETMNARSVNLHASSKMIHLINSTPQWKIMLDQGVFIPTEITSNQTRTNAEFTMTPLLVPHRNELSDMHAFILRGAKKSLLYLPDHDTWLETLAMHKSDNIRQWFNDLSIDIALIDALLAGEYQASFFAEQLAAAQRRRRDLRMRSSERLRGQAAYEIRVKAQCDYDASLSQP